MKKLLAILLLLASQAHATDATTNCALDFADLGTTVAAITLGGAVEANKLITGPAMMVAGVGLRCAAAAYVDTLPEPERTIGQTRVASFTGGLVAHNTVVLGAVVAHKFIGVAAAGWINPVALAVWIVTSAVIYHETAPERAEAQRHAEFDAMCAYFRITEPGLACEYKPLT
jgi:hypothetical protein